MSTKLLQKCNRCQAKFLCTKPQQLQYLFMSNKFVDHPNYCCTNLLIIPCLYRGEVVPSDCIPHKFIATATPHVIAYLTANYEPQSLSKVLLSSTLQVFNDQASSIQTLTPLIFLKPNHSSCQ